jgi:hypothetical protein
VSNGLLFIFADPHDCCRLPPTTRRQSLLALWR